MKHFWTFLQLPSIHQLWQLLGNSSLNLQNKPTLWRKHCKPPEPACLPAKWLIWVWNQSQCADNVEKTEGEKCWTAWNEPFLLCRIFFRFSKGSEMSTLGKFERFRGDLPHHPPPHTHDCGDTLFKPALKSFMLLESLSAEIQRLPSPRHPWKFLPLFYW